MLQLDSKKLVKRFHLVIKNQILEAVFYILFLFQFSFLQKKKRVGKQSEKNICNLLHNVTGHYKPI
jgi:hypothetical protein